MSQTSTRVTQTRMHANAQPTTRPLSSPPPPVSTPELWTSPYHEPPFLSSCRKEGPRPQLTPSERRSPPSPPGRGGVQSPSLNAKFHHPRKPPETGSQAASDISPSTYIPFPRQGIQTAAVCAHPRAGITKSQTEENDRRSFRWPVCATCTRPGSLDRILYAAGGQVCAVVGTVECAEIGAAAAGLGLVGGCLWLVAAGETSPASGVERRRGAGRALFGRVMGAGKGGET